MENVVFTQLSIPEFRKLIQQELEQFHKANATDHKQRRPDHVSGQAATPYVSKREAARLIGVCTSSIDNHARSGKLKRFYVGKAVRFDRAEVLALAKPHTNRRQGAV
ncbi:MAG: helix-turn-helix domain-containing protein [Saprospiraceae bacterium]